MNINKDLNRDSSTKDLLKFATEHGYHDNEGMDNSPSWMSQELDERAFAESKSCHPVLVKGEIPMTPTEKMLEEVKESLEKEMMVTLPDCDWQLVATKINQALAEERERMVREAEKVKFTIYDGDIKREVVGLEDVKHIDLLLKQTRERITL